MFNSEKLSKVCQYCENLLIGIDQLVNCIFGGAPDETISAVTYRHAVFKNEMRFKVFKVILDYTLSPIQHNHCEYAYKSEIYRRQLPKAYQTK